MWRVREGVKFIKLQVSICNSIVLFSMYLSVLFIAIFLSKTNSSNICFKMAKTELKVLQYKPKVG